MLARQRLTASLAFAALTAPFGILVHLVAELVGLGYRADASLIFSSRHAYLALVALISPLALFAAFEMLPRTDRRRAVERLIGALPFQGRSWRFAALSFFAQLGFFAVTQAGEGDPLGAGDLGTGILAALLASAVGAIALSFGRSRIIRIVLELVALLDLAPRTSELSSARHRSGVHLRLPHPRILISAYADLPPPCSSR